MLDFLNAIACMVMLAMAFPVAVAMCHRGFWIQRLILWAILSLLSLQVVAPLPNFEFVPSANWLQCTCNIGLALVVVAARRQAMAVIRLYMGPPAAERAHPMRRIEDFESLARD